MKQRVKKNKNMILRTIFTNFYTEKENIVEVRGEFLKILFGFIILKKGKVNFDICLEDIKSIQLTKSCTFNEACDYIINKRINYETKI